VVGCSIWACASEKFFVPTAEHLLVALLQQVEGLAQVDHSPSILLLDAVSERLHQLGGVNGEEGSRIQERLKALGHDGSVGDQGMHLGENEG
jgi:hypothetical protein